MVATPISAATRYYPPGTRQVYWMPAAADYTSPTRDELDAGTDLTGEIATVSGFSVASGTTDVPDLGHRFTSQIAGAITAASSSITMYLSQDSDDVRTLLPRDLAGFIVWFWEGDHAGQLMDVFPVRVLDNAKDGTTTNPGQVTIDFAITAVPQENVTIPS